MSGLLLIAVVLIWIWAAVAIARSLTSKLKPSWIKTPTMLLAVIVLIPLPVADEIVGGFQFHNLCDKYAVQFIDEKNATNRRVFYVPRGQDVYAENTAVRIQINPRVYKDAETGKVLVSSHTLIANGGWLIRTLGISETNIDIISDFLRGTDKIALSGTVFTKLLNDSDLSDNILVSGVGAQTLDANDYLIYNTSTKALYYDADGSGTANAPIQFATLINVANISATDFIVI